MTPTTSFIVFYEVDTYNPNKTYPQNFNRYARHKYFATLEDAQAFAKTVKKPDIRDGVNTMKRYPLA